jgi:hypothetical protein
MPFKRDAFLYLEPKKGSYGKSEDYAQCGTCMMWVPDKKNCMIHSPKINVTFDTTCGLYVNGKPHEGGQAKAFVTPKESGAFKKRVQCQRCRYYRSEGSKCMLFVVMNRQLEGEAKLYPERVHPNGCCNAWVSYTESP